MRERFGPRDLRRLAACAAVLALTVWFSANYFYRAFPEASIDFVVTRAQAQSVAKRFLVSQGHRPETYRLASRFSFDDRAKTFLERELGLEQANRLMGSRIRLWRWSYRWFRPLEKEEYRVEITPRGETVGFEHLVAESAPMASLPADQARALAERFLRETMGRDPAALDFVEASRVARPARADHAFTWKEKNFTVTEATYRLEVAVTGDRVGGYREYLKIPEAWLRDYDRLRSRNQAAQAVDTVLTVLLAAGLLATLFLRVRSRDVRWRPAAAIGTLGAILFFLSSWNQQPLAEFSYPTMDSYSSFWIRRMLQNVLVALASGGFLAVLTAAAEPLYREHLASRISLGNLFHPRGLRTKSFFMGCALGLTLTGVFVAYQTAFYLLAYRWGAWSPADVPYDDLLNTRFPWLYVLFGGFFPAVSEEFLFRMFSIPFLRKLARSTAAAVILAGFIWGFGHAGYPQQPFYIRGVEVGIGGVFLGVVMLRRGILPTLVWHYSVDALYAALLLLRSHNPYFVLSGAASAGIMVLPLLGAWIAYLRGGGFEPGTELTNEHEKSSLEAAEAPAEPRAAAPATDSPWSRKRRLAAVALIAAALGSLRLSVDKFGDVPRFRLGADQALAAGDEFLRGRGLDPGAFRHVVYPIDRWDPDVGKYFLERREVASLREAYHQTVPLYSWAVRYYRPQEKEEVNVSFDPETGNMAGFDHSLPEDRPGADLAAPDVQKISAAYLSAAGYDLSRLELKETETEKQKARRDYTLVWESRPGDPRNLDEGRFRLRVQVAGDRVMHLNRYWKLPETYVRERSQRNALANALFALRALWGGAAFLLALTILVQRTRRHELAWRQALTLALPLAGLAALGAISDALLSFRTYNTAVDPDVFLATMVTSVAITAIGLALSLGGASALLLALCPRAAAALQRENRRRAALDALLAAALAVSLATGLSQVRWLLTDRFHAQALISVATPETFGAAVPAISALADAASEALTALALIALAAYSARAIFRRRWVAVPALLVALMAFVSGQAHTAGEFALEYAITVLSAGVLVAFCWFFARNNYLAYALAAWSWAAVRQAAGLLMQPAASLRQQGALVAAALALTLAWAALPALRRAQPADRSPV